MTIDLMTYEPRGDKQNSDFFETYRLKVFERRTSSGLGNLLGDIKALVVQVETDEALPYLQELYAMTNYRLQAGYVSKTHKIYWLANSPEQPAYIVLEPLDHDFCDDFSRLNKLYPNSRPKPNARYIGEIIHTKNLNETQKILESHDFNFHNPGTSPNPFYCNKHFKFTQISNLSCNALGYVSHDIHDHTAFDLGQPFTLTKSQQAALDKVAQFSSDKGLDKLILGIDHMATRILAAEREDAILELLSLTNYYFWGAYNIADMNSSTNVNRSLHGKDRHSPAKVFTANNTPFMVNSFEGLPMPTENFVRNYGRRMHHIAYEIKDGDHATGVKNLDYVIDTLRDEGNIAFLAKVFGECHDEPNLKQIFSRHSQYTYLITEYVERCHGFDGFFTKDNVAALTEAAGQDEALKKHADSHGHVFD